MFSVETILKNTYTVCNYHPTQDTPSYHPKEIPPVPLISFIPFPVVETTDLVSAKCRLVLSILEFHFDEVIQSVQFCFWIFFLSVCCFLRYKMNPYYCIYQ